VDDSAGDRPLSDPPGSTVEIPAGVEAAIVLLRHGESVHITEGRFQGQADSPLSPLGERQAALAAERLADPGRRPALPIAPRPPLEIAYSPLLRASRTAELVAAAMAGGGDQAVLRADPDLRELAQGRWEGKRREEIEAEDGELLAAWRRDPLRAHAPGGESVIEGARRARATAARVVVSLAAAPEGQARTSWTARAVVDGYPGPARADAPWSLLVGHDGLFKLVMLALLDLPLERFWAFSFALCGLTVVELRDGRAVLRAHNLVEHLAVLADEPRAEAEAASREATGAL
jgi:broad specificity phosphatase PhoE